MKNLGEEYLSLFDKLREGDYDENIRHLNYKFKNFSKNAIEHLKKKSSVIDENQEQLESSPSPQEPLKSMKAIEEEPTSSIGYQHVECQTSRSKVKIVKYM